MKKIIALLLAVFMLLSLCACGNGQETGSSDENPTTSTSEPSVEEVKKVGLRVDLKAVTNTVKVTSSTGESEDLIDHGRDGYEYVEHPLTKSYYKVPGAFSYNAWNCVYEMKEQPLDTEYTFTYESAFESRGGTMFLMNENFYYTFYSIPSSLKIDLNGTITSDYFSVNVAKLRSEDVTDIEYFYAFSASGKNITFKKINDNEYMLSSTEPIESLEITPDSGLKYTATEQKTSYKITLDE